MSPVQTMAASPGGGDDGDGINESWYNSGSGVGPCPIEEEGGAANTVCANTRGGELEAVDFAKQIL